MPQEVSRLVNAQPSSQTGNSSVSAHLEQAEAVGPTSPQKVLETRPEVQPFFVPLCCCCRHILQSSIGTVWYHSATGAGWLHRHVHMLILCMLDHAP